MSSGTPRPPSSGAPPTGGPTTTAAASSGKPKPEFGAPSRPKKDAPPPSERGAPPPSTKGANTPPVAPTRPPTQPFTPPKKKTKGSGISIEDLPIAKLVTGVFATLGVIGIVVLAVTLGRSCQRPSTHASLTPPPANLAPDAGVAPDSPRALSELWQRVLEANDDPIELARLAEAEGAMGLLEALEEGGGVGVAALSALPFADDAELALARLAEISRQVDESALGPVLDAIEGIVQQPLHQREHYDPTGAHAAFDAMVELTKREKLAKPLRARAVSVARLIAARGPYDTNLLPKDLDAQ